MYNQIYLLQRSSVDNIYKAVANSSLGCKSQSAATSPTNSSAYKNRLTSSNASGLAQKNAPGISDSTNSSPRRNGNTSSKTSNEAWVCPSDRQLALRAK